MPLIDSKLTKLVAIFAGVLVPLISYEIYLRAVDYRPLSPKTRASILSFPTAYQADSELGWKLIPGVHRFAPVSSSALETVGRIEESGARATLPVGVDPPEKPEGKILFIGDSFTFGDGLNDDESYPWLVQRALPTYRVYNFAVPGYGTCQSYLELRSLLRAGEYDGAEIVYGMSEFHETRNIPDLRTAWQFAAVSVTKSYQAPSCVLDPSGGIDIQPAKRYFDPVPLLSENFSVGRRLVHFYYDIVGWRERSERRPISLALLKAINRTAMQHNSKFTVLLQRFEPASMAEYERFLDDEKIRYVDGSHPMELTPKMQIAGDGHPNAVMNAYWGELLANKLIEKR